MGTDGIELELRLLEMPYEHLRIRDPRHERDLLLSMEETGQQFSITVIPADHPDFYTVIDGHGRVRTQKRLGRDTVRAQVLNLPAPEALLWVRVSQAASPLSAFEEGLLIRELMESHSLNLDAIAQRLARSKSWVLRRLDLVRTLPEAIQKYVVDGRISPHSAMKCLAPLARANPEHAVTLARAIAKEKLSTRDVERLWAHYRAGSDEVRRELLANPLRFLKADEAYRESRGEPDTDEQEVIVRLERLAAMLAATTTRTRKVVREGVGVGPTTMERLKPACALVSQAMQNLAGALNSVLNWSSGENRE